MTKIAYIIDSMYNSGGMERVLTVCANVLAKSYDITIITGFQLDRPYFFQLSSAVRCHDLKIKERMSCRMKKKEYKERLSFYLKKESFDIVISLGGMDFSFLYSIHDGSKKIVWFHFAYNVAYTSWIGDSVSCFKKIRGYMQHVKRVCHARKYTRIIAISRSDFKSWKRVFPHVVLIYNPVTINAAGLSDKKEKRAISVGRLDFQKGFDYLISVWHLVIKKHPDWHLDIYGDGPLRDVFRKQIDEMGMSGFITLCGKTSNIAEKYVSHSIYIMTSRTEAFGLVLLEASLCSLPLIAFDCPGGPRDIIKNGKNGFLIEQVGNTEEMAEAISTLIEDESLRNKMGNKAFQMVERFSLTRIKKEWIKLFNELC